MPAHRATAATDHAHGAAGRPAVPLEGRKAAVAVAAGDRQAVVTPLAPRDRAAVCCPRRLRELIAGHRLIAVFPGCTESFVHDKHT